MNGRLTLGLICIASVAAAGVPLTAAAGPESANAGTLTCTAVAATHEEGQLSCTFEPASGDGAVEYYAGRIPSTNLSPTEKTIVVWTVWSPTTSVPPGSLEGTFAASAERSSSGGNVLAGRDLFLEPLTSTPNASPNVASTIGKLTLMRNLPRV